MESVNGAAEEMLFAGLPRYTHRQTQINGAPVDPDQPALTFEAFVAEVLAFSTNSSVLGHGPTRRCCSCVSATAASRRGLPV